MISEANFEMLVVALRLCKRILLNRVLKVFKKSIKRPLQLVNYTTKTAAKGKPGKNPDLNRI